MTGAGIRGARLGICNRLLHRVLARPPRVARMYRYIRGPRRNGK